MKRKIYDEQDERIQKVIDEVENNEMKLYEAWNIYLMEKLKFPFEAEVNEYQESRSNIQQGDRLNVKGIESIESLYGIIVQIQFEGYKSCFPLCDLEAIDLDDVGKQALCDYRVWFANN